MLVASAWQSNRLGGVMVEGKRCPNRKGSVSRKAERIRISSRGSFGLEELLKNSLRDRRLRGSKGGSGSSSGGGGGVSNVDNFGLEELLCQASSCLREEGPMRGGGRSGDRRKVNDVGSFGLDELLCSASSCFRDDVGPVPRQTQSVPIVPDAASVRQTLNLEEIFCHASCLDEENQLPTADRPLHLVLIRVLAQLDTEDGTSALRELYQLCDNRHRHNRIPMVCSTSKWDVLSSLLRRMSQADRPGLHLICLTLNNLSIPYQNKAVMVLGPHSTSLLANLATVIQQQKPEAAICLITLVNLSLLKDAINPILNFAIPDHAQLNSPPSLLHNPNALIKILENLMNSNPTTPQHITVHSEALRYACGLASNLCVSELNASLIAKTDIPQRILGYLRTTTIDSSQWTVDSIEDFALRVVNRLAWWPSSRLILYQHQVQDVMQIIADTGETIYAFRAGKMLQFLQAKKPQNFDIDTTPRNYHQLTNSTSDS